MFSDKYGAYGGAVRTKDEKVTKGTREIHIIAFKTQSRFVLAQRLLLSSFCYTEAVKIPEVLPKIKELCVSFESSRSQVVKTGFRIERKKKGKEEEIKPYKRQRLERKSNSSA